MNGQDLAAEAEAYLRDGGAFGYRLGRFIQAEVDPLINLAAQRGGDPHQEVLLPVAALLRRAADRLERGLDDPGR